MPRKRILKNAGKSSPKAMMLNYKYHVEFNHNLDRIFADPDLKKVWDGLTNEERTYVLKGGRNIYGF